MITYKKPTTLQGILTTYRKIAHNEKSSNNTISGSSRPCNKCSLCGNFGKHSSMVESTTFIFNHLGNKIFFKQHLTCNNFGIYAAQCKLCSKFYAGQT